MHRALPGLAAVLVGAALYDGYHWLRAASFNRAITDGSIVSRDGELPPEAIFARAYWHAAAGHPDSALAGYKAAAEGTASMKTAAFYNAGNIYQRQANQLLADSKQELARPLIELAKQSYRDALRAEPGYWDAKYNLERALRLAPELDEEGAAPPQPDKRAPTTTRGFTLDLP